MSPSQNELLVLPNIEPAHLLEAIHAKHSVFDCAAFFGEDPRTVQRSEHLKHHDRVSIGVHQCQRVFDHMGFRLRKPRPQEEQSDSGRMAAFKKWFIALYRGRRP